MVQEQLDIQIQKEKEVGSIPSTIYKINLNLINNLNIRATVIKYVKGSIGVNLYEFGFDSDFLHMLYKHK